MNISNKVFNVYFAYLF